MRFPVSGEKSQAIFIAAFFAAVFALLANYPAAACEAPGMWVAGYVEKALVFPGGLKIPAKLDSGAKNSSLNAQNIKYFKQGETD